MKSGALLLILFSGAAILAQAPSPQPSTHTYNNPLGFSYAIPTDWDVVDPTANLPGVKQQATQNAGSEEEKKGVACVQVGVTARHGQSVIVEVALPFDCFGQTISENDLPGFASGASEGIKQNFDVTNPVTGTYKLGTHTMWIERATGIPKTDPGSQYTIEIACALLQKAAACWMTMAADQSSLAVFEHGAVTLDSDPPVALVPVTAFEKKPS